MSDRFALGGHASLEAALAELSSAVRFPATPVLAPAVLAQIQAPSRPHWWTPLAPGRRSLGRSLALAGVAVLLVAGVAGAIGIGIGAIQIRFADGSPLPTPVASIPNRGLGQPTTLAEAEAAVPFTIRIPAGPVLGPPDAVYLAAIPEGGTVSLAWGDRPGYPAGADGLGVVVTEFLADIGPETFEKMVLAGTRVEAVTVNGQRGWWVEGGFHAFFYRDANGQMVDTSLRLVGSALIWQESGLALRVEGAPDLASAMRVAASLE
jgi:hypothetical protein